MNRLFPFSWLVVLVTPLIVAGEPTVSWDSLTQNLTGVWKNEAGTTEEHWTTAADGLMLGMNRDMRKPGRPFFEYLRIEQREDGVYYVAQPRGKSPTAFKLVKQTANEVVFQNADHDFPQVITYVREGARLCAWIGSVAEPKKSHWCWDKQASKP
ncbi:DUF6265 family protein [Acanthopleuribacter pedis]|uniref:DUF6265 domain-containing protein n=1 Tax=Acanthopleuribacter pedis TaxID=442870 RepID=A0A8J7Q4W5_9BACT|nr:DUF6265 family protein [Acanthopleuribacter pedis]MBO1318099.1 hypothetical protein [Acanthopleuribacter pedis]